MKIGAFGARNVPKAMKIIEVAGIIQARKWYVPWVSLAAGHSLMKLSLVGRWHH